MDKALKDHSTEEYFILFNNGLYFNHMAHGIVALHRLGANPDALETFAKTYGSLLDEPDKHQANDIDFDPEYTIDDLKGKRKGYYVLLDHYDKLLKETYSGSLEDIIKKEFPKLKHSIGAAALHGVIHVGYGYTAKSARVVCEGLAFLHYASVPLTLTPGTFSPQHFGQGNRDILDVLETVRSDNDCSELFKRKVREQSPDVDLTGFSSQMKVVLLHMGDDLARYVNQIRLTDILDPLNMNPDAIAKLWKWLVDCAIIVYAGSETCNDFFLLHGVTSAWSLAQIMKLFNDPSEVLETVHIFLSCLFAAYIVVKCPAVSLTKLISRANECKMTWEDIIGKAKGTLPDGGKEHIYKVVQVCWDMHKNNKDENMENVYRQAAFNAISNDLAFIYDH